jgi:hypothetical protein
MDKIEAFMKYASRLVGLDDLIEYAIVDGTGQERTRAICDRENYRIYFNKQWLEKATRVEVLECVLHECRHCYQQACIEFPIDFNKERLEIVNQWKYEFENPINPYTDEKGYNSQLSEIDAIKFTKETINTLKSWELTSIELTYFLIKRLHTRL